jgi:hypothetical protein
MIDDSMLDSEPWLGLTDNAARLAFFALLLNADRLGNAEANPARLLHWWRDFGIDTKAKVASTEMALADAGLVTLYGPADRQFVHIPNCYKEPAR